MDTSTIALLRRISLFQSLDPNPLEFLANHSRRRQFAVGEALFHEGDPGHTLYVIASGSVSIQTTTSEGHTVHLAQRGPGEHFGELALIDGQPRMADAVTSAPCDLLMLDRAAFVECIERSPKAALCVMASLAERLRQAADRYEERQSLDTLGRVSGVLLSLLEQGASDAPDGGKVLAARLSQQALAERAGTTRETANRALSSLKAVRAIRLEGRKIVVLDSARLRRYSEV